MVFAGTVPGIRHESRFPHSTLPITALLPHFPQTNTTVLSPAGIGQDEIDVRTLPGGTTCPSPGKLNIRPEDRFNMMGIEQRFVPQDLGARRRSWEVADRLSHEG